MTEASEGVAPVDRWQDWLLNRNRRGMRTLLWIILALYPAFGVLDYLLASSAARTVLWGIRALVTLMTLVMFALVARPVFVRWGHLLSAGYMLACALGMSATTVFLGGLASPYYAGLSLAIVATGLLFVWPPGMVVVTHGSIVASFVLPNLVLDGFHLDAVAASNLVFLVATALVTSVGQILGYRSAREQVRAQASILQTQQDLENVHQQLKQLDRLKSQFFANVTHELRTPITMILAPVDSILSEDFGPLTPTQRSFLEANRRNGIRLLKLINDLLDLAKLEEGFLRLRPERSDLRQLLEDVLAYARPLAARKTLALDLSIKSASSNLHVDLEKMERVIVNLLSNALKFTEKGGVNLSMEVVGSEVQIVVEDSGIGIAPEYVAHTFDRFSQEDTSVTRKYGGTGIGLAYAKEIVELHGGSLSVTSALGRGSRFVVHLPEGDSVPEELRDRRQQRAPFAELKRGDDQEPREWAQRLQRQLEYRFAEIDQVTDRRVVTEGEAQSGQSGQSAQGARILVVEDNADILEMISLQLQGKHRIFAARDGQQGLEVAERERPDLIITDYMMPNMDGLTMLKAVRENAQLADVPVIMLSAKSQLADRVSAREAGADVYLAKPFSPRELEAVVRQHLAKRGRQIQGIMRAHAEGLETISGGLAHEIHNPLNFIKNANLVIAENVAKLQQALPTDLSPERAALVQKARDKIERMVESAGRGVVRIEKVVQLLRQYAREGFPTEPVDVDFDQAVAEVTGLVAPQGDVEAVVSLDVTSKGTLRVIPEELNQVVLSLVMNAIESVGSSGGRVEVRTRAVDRELWLEVVDNGPGISADSVARIFSPFFTTKAGSGRGLGLAIVQVVVARMGGTVEVSSVPRVETIFRVRLPAAGASAAAQPAVPAVVGPFRGGSGPVADRPRS